MKRFIASRLARFRKDTRGAMVTYIAVITPVLVGFAGLSIDVGVWYANARMAQGVADAAAMAGALEVLRSDSDPTAIDAAVATEAATHGFDQTGDNVDPNWPPTSGAFAGSGDSVEVLVSRPVQSFLSQILFSGGTTVTARAVAQADMNNTCIWSMNQTDPSTVNISGGAQVSLACGVLVNSNDPGALNQSGSSCLGTTEVKVVGGVDGGDCISANPITGVSPVSDPLESLPDPTYGPCDYSSNFNINSGQSHTFEPGVYCGKITIQGGATADFKPGLYVLDDKSALTISGDSTTVTGDDVSFYLTEGVNQSPEALSITGGNVTLSAPSDGPLPGVLFYHDRDVTNTITHKLTGGGNMQLEGILYFPSSELQFAGGSSTDSSTSLIIADKVTFTGNTDIGDFENTPILSNPLLITARLVE